MTTIPITAYSFNPTTRAVTFTNLTVVDPNRVAGIYDTSLYAEGQEFGAVLFVAESAPQASASGNVLTLPIGSIPSGANSTDQLKITYNIDAPEGQQTLRFAHVSSFPGTGAEGYLYLANDTGQLYAWDGAAFVAV